MQFDLQLSSGDPSGSTPPSRPLVTIRPGIWSRYEALDDEVMGSGCHFWRAYPEVELDLTLWDLSEVDMSADVAVLLTCHLMAQQPSLKDWTVIASTAPTRIDMK